MTPTPAEWNGDPDHEPRADQLSLFDAGDPLPEPPAPGRKPAPTGPTLFDLIPTEDA